MPKLIIHDTQTGRKLVVDFGNSPAPNQQEINQIISDSGFGQSGRPAQPNPQALASDRLNPVIAQRRIDAADPTIPGTAANRTANQAALQGMFSKTGPGVQRLLRGPAYTKPTPVESPSVLSQNQQDIADTLGNTFFNTLPKSAFNVLATPVTMPYQATRKIANLISHGNQAQVAWLSGDKKKAAAHQQMADKELSGIGSMLTGLVPFYNPVVTGIKERSVKAGLSELGREVVQDPFGVVAQTAMLAGMAHGVRAGAANIKGYAGLTRAIKGVDVADVPGIAQDFGRGDLISNVMRRTKKPTEPTVRVPAIKVDIPVPEPISTTPLAAPTSPVQARQQPSGTPAPVAPVTPVESPSRSVKIGDRVTVQGREGVHAVMATSEATGRYRVMDANRQGAWVSADKLTHVDEAPQVPENLRYGTKSDPVYSMVQDLYNNDPNLKPSDIQQQIKIGYTRAVNLLDSIKSDTGARTTEISPQSPTASANLVEPQKSASPQALASALHDALQQNATGKEGGTVALKDLIPKVRKALGIKKVDYPDEQFVADVHNLSASDVTRDSPIELTDINTGSKHGAASKILTHVDANGDTYNYGGVRLRRNTEIPQEGVSTDATTEGLQQTGDVTEHQSRSEGRETSQAGGSDSLQQVPGVEGQQPAPVQEQGEVAATPQGEVAPQALADTEAPVPATKPEEAPQAQAAPQQAKGNLTAEERNKLAILRGKRNLSDREFDLKMELENKAKGGITLAANPVPAYAGATMEHTVLPTVQRVVDVARSVKEFLNPAKMATVEKTPTGTNSRMLAGQQARNIRENAAILARKKLRAETVLHDAAKAFDRLPEPDRLNFIDEWETGKSISNPKMQAFVKLLKDALDEAVKSVETLGPEHINAWIQDYFPHIWKDPEGATRYFSEMMGKRPLEGSKGFQKQRTIPTTKEGMFDASGNPTGLEPVTTNPVDLMLAKIHELNRYRMGQDVFNEMKSTGLAKLVRPGGAPPAGWVALEGRTFKVTEVRPTTKADGTPGAPEFIDRGTYYAPKEVARILNNYLSPGLGGQPIYDFVRYGANLLNQAQLGLSAFHMTFTAMDSTISKFALGMELATRGRRLRGAVEAGKALVPLYAPIENFLRGDKLLKESLRPGSQGGDWAEIADSLQAGGGRVRMDDFYQLGQARPSAMGDFFKALKRGDFMDALQEAMPRTMNSALKNDLAGIFKSIVPDIIESTARPLMQEVVPRMKLGIFADMARMELERLGPNASRNQVRDVMGKAWDSVDNRMGQLVYDNLFWKKWQKDMALLTVRSVGWNIGTYRELGGGVYDLLNTGKRLRSGENFLSHRMAYTIALPLVTAFYNSIYQYLATGKGPQEWTDYLFPKTGGKTPDGKDERVAIPSYMKDVYAYWKHPQETLGHKINPELATIIELQGNKDFFGNQIADPDDPIYKRAIDKAIYATQAAVPFSLRNAERMKQAGDRPAKRIQAFMGILPAPSEVSRTPAENLIYRYLNEAKPQAGVPKTQRERADFSREVRQSFRDKGLSGHPLSDAIAHGVIMLKEAAQMSKRIGQGNLVSLYKNEAIDFPKAIRIFEIANRKERDVLRPLLVKRMINWQLNHGNHDRLAFKAQEALSINKND